MAEEQVDYEAYEEEQPMAEGGGEDVSWPRLRRARRRRGAARQRESSKERLGEPPNLARARALSLSLSLLPLGGRTGDEREPPPPRLSSRACVHTLASAREKEDKPCSPRRARTTLPPRR